MAKVSVIVPMYKGGKRVYRIIRSLLAQTYKDMEILLIDDGSGDETYDIAKATVEKFNGSKGKSLIPVKLYKRTNHGVAVTRNFGIQEAEGKYVMFADQDDFVNHDYVEKLVKAAEEAEADLVVGGYVHITDQKKKMLEVSPLGREFDPYIVTAPWAHIYKRQMLLTNHVEFLTTSIGEDVYFNMRAYAVADKIISIPDMSYQWIYNTESVSNSKQSVISDKVNPLLLLNRIYEDIDNEAFLHSRIVEYFFARYICWYMLFSSRGSRREDIEDCFNKLDFWMKSHYPGFMKNKFLNWGKPKGEFLKFYVFVQGYYFLYRAKLLLPVLKLFGK